MYWIHLPHRQRPCVVHRPNTCDAGDDHEHPIHVAWATAKKIVAVDWMRTDLGRCRSATDLDL